MRFAHLCVVGVGEGVSGSLGGELQAQKKTSVDVFRCVFGGPG